jgi:hypothetical protein
MPINKKGLSANRKPSTSVLSSGVQDLTNILGKIKGKTQVGRVKDIILDINYPEIEKFGGESAIGTIFFELQNNLSAKALPARPFFPQISSYPLVNELVLLFQLPNQRIGNNRSEKSYYYMNMISLWNHPHHNAYPNPASDNALKPTTQDTYANTEKGMVRNSKGDISSLNFNSPTNPSQATFFEKDDIHPLLPFAGDIIHQGRWGNTIRLGSTAASSTGQNLNPWSNNGFNGDPITLIKNGQPFNVSNQGWTHIVEDINNDLSSIYLTSYQSIPLTPASENYRSFPSPPESVQSYSNPQVIIASGRLVFNAKNDSILLSAQKSVSMSTNGSVNINTKNFLIDSGNIRLGSKDARESIIKGDTLYFQLDQMLKALLQMLAVLKTSTMAIDPSTVKADITKNQVYGNVETSLQLIQEDLESILSKNVKTI